MNGAHINVLHVDLVTSPPQELKHQCKSGHVGVCFHHPAFNEPFILYHIDLLDEGVFPLGKTLIGFGTHVKDFRHDDSFLVKIRLNGKQLIYHLFPFPIYTTNPIIFAQSCILNQLHLGNFTTLRMKEQDAVNQSA